MSQSVIVPPVHETSPPPFDDDDVDENDVVAITTAPDDSPSPLTTAPDVVDNSNDEWKSVDNNNDTDLAQVEDDVTFADPVTESADAIPPEEEPTPEKPSDDDGWANFAAFEPQSPEVSETPVTTTSATAEETDENDWANFESSPATVSEPPPSTPPLVPEETSKATADNRDDDDDADDDFGEFSEVQAAPKSATPSLPVNTLSTEQLESLISTCFPTESEETSFDHKSFAATDLPSFTSFRERSKQVECLQSSLSLWNALSNLSNDPVGIQFQWRKSNAERLFHQSLGVNERFRARNMPLTPEILQPEKIKSIVSGNSNAENLENENKAPAEPVRPHFDWKQSGLQNPLSDNDSSSLSSNVSKNEENVFDANKTLDLDFYVPTSKSPAEGDSTTTSPSSNQLTDSPIIPQQLPLPRYSAPIKTVDLFPGSTTTLLSDDAKRIIDTLPNLSFMSAKALMFPIRFNANNNDELY